MERIFTKSTFESREIAFDIKLTYANASILKDGKVVFNIKGKSLLKG